MACSMFVCQRLLLHSRWALLVLPLALQWYVYFTIILRRFLVYIFFWMTAFSHWCVVTVVIFVQSGHYQWCHALVLDDMWDESSLMSLYWLAVMCCLAGWHATHLWVHDFQLLHASYWSGRQYQQCDSSPDKSRTVQRSFGYILFIVFDGYGCISFYGLSLLDLVRLVEASWLSVCRVTYWCSSTLFCYCLLAWCYIHPSLSHVEFVLCFPMVSSHLVYSKQIRSFLLMIWCCLCASHAAGDQLSCKNLLHVSRNCKCFHSVPATSQFKAFTTNISTVHCNLFTVVIVALDIEPDVGVYVVISISVCLGYVLYFKRSDASAGDCLCKSCPCSIFSVSCGLCRNWSPFLCM